MNLRTLEEYIAERKQALGVENMAVRVLYFASPGTQLTWVNLHAVDSVVMRDSGEENPVLLLLAGAVPLDG